MANYKREQIRAEIAHKFKDEITELKLQNSKLAKSNIEKDKQIKELEAKVAKLEEDLALYMMVVGDGNKELSILQDLIRIEKSGAGVIDFMKKIGY